MKLLRKLSLYCIAFALSQTPCTTHAYFSTILKTALVGLLAQTRLNSGTETFFRFYGLEEDDQALSIASMPEGGYAITGYVQMTLSDQDVFVALHDSDGERTFFRTFEYPPSSQCILLPISL